jgi:hypothetical protein
MSFETAFNVRNLVGSLLVIVEVLYVVGNFIRRNRRRYVFKPRDVFRGACRGRPPGIC